MTFAKNTQLKEYSDEIIINLPGNREDFYMDTNYFHILSKLTKMASTIADNLGVTPFIMDMPILE